jgi:hypothetical protein
MADAKDNYTERKFWTKSGVTRRQIDQNLLQLVLYLNSISRSLGERDL